MNRFYIARLINGVPILIESTYTAICNDEYVLTARDNQRFLLGGITNQLPPVIHKNHTFGELVQALRWLVLEAEAHYSELVDNYFINEQLVALIGYAGRWHE